jgi:hypothetical protein
MSQKQQVLNAGIGTLLSAGLAYFNVSGIPVTRNR